MKLKKLILEHYGDTDDILFADGLDDAIIGFEPNAWKVVYSRNECIKVMVKEGMDDEEAIEYLEFNTFGAYVGEKTPIWAETFDWEL